ncbi:glycosyl hydrolase family 18 protein [Hymenobacter sp.]|uniref:glycosyl hydrolase family 18 protein n=1 Tax=Hymenobacter sp. TaxID=1898978 RepID=UPI00286BBD8E|nr:glycosyl hydrolase family 18 protein [Hymenobacter sp.]
MSPVRRLAYFLGLLLLVLPELLLAQVSPPVPKKRTDHTKQLIGYITQWGPWKNIPGLIPKGSLNQLNIDYSQYTILNFSFFGVAVDGSLHSGDYRNANINQPGVDQQPAALLNKDTYSSWDLYLLQGELDLVQYVSDGSYPYSLGYRNATSGWSNVNTGETGAFPLAIHKQGGRLGLLELAHQQGVKALASVGGWSMSKHFGDMAAAPAKRARFVADCQKLIALGFDGIDLDWEYPGQAGMNFTGQPQDYTNFALLVEEIRAAVGPGKLITAAFSAVPAKFTQFDWARLSRTMDYFNFMTYDYNGGWSNKAGHNSPLYDYPNAEYPSFSLNATTLGIKAAGIPLNKVNLGVAFYGRGVVTSGPAALNAPTVKRQETVSPDGAVSTCADFANWPKDVWDGTPNYQAIVANTASWTDAWDDNAKVPYKTNGTYFLSYDNERSVGLKAQYIKDQQLAGAIIWTASGDWTNLAANPVVLGGKLVYSPDTRAPLVNKMNEVFGSGSVAPANAPPTVSLSAPANNATLSAGASATISATAADADGTISQVAFYNGSTLLGTDTSSPYSYVWTNVVAGSYSLTAKATDNLGAVTTSAAVSVTVTGGTPPPPASTQGRVIVGYFHTWNNASAPYIRLKDVNPKYNVVNIAFAEPISAGDMTMVFTPTLQPKAEFIADLRLLQGQGRKVLISIGGANAPVELNTTADKDKFVASMKAIVNEYGFDGFDIDLEGTSVILNSGDTNFKSSTTPKINNLVTASRELTTFFRGQGKDFWLTSAPEVQYVQGGYGNYGTAFGGYLPVLYGLRDLLTYVHVQYYNTGSQNALDDKIYSQGTADFIVAMTDMLLKGFPVARNAANFFPALRQDQVAFGLPATGTGAAPAGGYVTPADVTKALNYLVKGTAYGGQYPLTATYPNLRGIMTWSANWDKTQGDPFVTNAYNFFSTLGTGTNTPPTVSLSGPANGATFAAPAAITLTANAADANGSVSSVDFYNGTTLLGTDTSSPYSYAWTGVAAGSYSLTAKATDNQGAATTSAAVSVTVTGTPPAAQAIPGTIQGESYSAMLGIQTEATTDAGGGLNVNDFTTNEWVDYSVNVAAAGTYTVGFRVASANGGATLQLRNSGGTVLGSVAVGNTGGWQNWQTINATVSLPAGAQTLRVFAQASTGCNLNYLAFTTGPAANTPPTASLSGPATGATATAPAAFTLTANAADADGTVSQVAFYNGSTLLGTDTSSPYSYAWTGVAAGSYSLTARATDNLGAVTTSAAVSVSVTAAGGGTCTVAAWQAATVYVGTNQASRNGNLYTAKWWTQGEDPATASCPDCVWRLVGPCGSGGGNTPPTVSFTSPAGGASFTAPASVAIAATATDNVAVAKVEFFNGSTLLSSSSAAPYSYTWANVAAGTYTLTATATDNAGLTASTTQTITVNSVTPNPNPNPNTSLPTRIMSGYWHTWNGGVPFIKLRDVHPGWDVINISFAEPIAAGSTDGRMKLDITGLSAGYTKADFKADVKTLQGQGKKIVLSIGGYEGFFSLGSTGAVTQFANDIKSIVNEYGFDGIDIDTEQSSVTFNGGADPDFKNPTSPKVVNLIAAIRQVVSAYPSTFILSWAPETFYFQMGRQYYGGSNGNVDTRSGIYIPMIHALRDRTTYVQAQLYNSAQMQGNDGQMYTMGTVEGVAAMTEMVIQGFTVGSPTGALFPGLRADQVVIAVPASQGAAGSGQISNAGLQEAFRRVNTKYPGVRGIMTWSINWDAFQNGNSFVTSNAAFLKSLPAARLAGNSSALSAPAAKSPAAAALPVDLYPNPVLAGARLTLDLGARYAAVQVVLTDLAGRQIATHSFRDVRSAQFSLPPRDKGVLMLRIVADGNTCTRRVAVD